MFSFPIIATFLTVPSMTVHTRVTITYTDEVIDQISGRAYSAYCKSVGGIAFNGDILPEWSAVRENLREAWREATRATLQYAVEIKPGKVANG
jgi:hypothetical protein